MEKHRDSTHCSAEPMPPLANEISPRRGPTDTGTPAERLRVDLAKRLSQIGSGGDQKHITREGRPLHG